MLVIGEKEMNEGKASIRRQGKGDLGAKDLNEFITGNFSSRNKRGVLCNTTKLSFRFEMIRQID